jgi:hypothetical protein
MKLIDTDTKEFMFYPRWGDYDYTIPWVGAHYVILSALLSSLEPHGELVVQNVRRHSPKEMEGYRYETRRHSG